MSTESVVKASNWRQVEVGRVVLVNKGKYAGKLATIVEIIDQKKVCLTMKYLRKSIEVKDMLNSNNTKCKGKAMMPYHCSG